MITLGLDCSSTTIGYAVCDGERIVTQGHLDLKGEIAIRCHNAGLFAGDLFRGYQPMLTIIESPVAKFAKAVIPQARVSGAVLASLCNVQALWQEVTPKVGKVALAGKGNADKRQMVEAAAARLGLTGAIVERSGKVMLICDGVTLLTEDEADAIGLALAGQAIKVRRAA